MMVNTFLMNDKFFFL